MSPAAFLWQPVDLLLRSLIVRKRLYEYGCVTEMGIAQLIYGPMEPQGALKDFQFSRAAMKKFR